MQIEIFFEAVMSSWFKNEELGWMERFACRVLAAGPTPRHVAFIMDGNRRFARKTRLQSVQDGHSSGFDQLSKVCSVCFCLACIFVVV